MTEKNEIKLGMDGPVTLFEIKGDVTVDSDPFFKEAYKSANDQGAGRILFKFEEDAYINSGGIAVLIQLLAETKKNAQKTGITGISDHFKKIFNMVGITKFSEIYTSVDEAMKGLSD
jgi:anti-anti-sigma factor